MHCGAQLMRATPAACMLGGSARRPSTMSSTQHRGHVDTDGRGGARRLQWGRMGLSYLDRDAPRAATVFGMYSSTPRCEEASHSSAIGAVAVNLKHEGWRDVGTIRRRGVGSVLASGRLQDLFGHDS